MRSCRWQRWKIRLISLLVAAAVLSALVGALFVHQTVEQAAFTPIEAAYESLAQGSPAALQAALYPDLCRTLEDLGYFRPDGSWSVQLRDWQAVYGAAFTAEPALRRVRWIRGSAKEDYLRALEREYLLSARAILLLQVDYTVHITAENADASVRKSAYTAYCAGSWYLMQETF